MSIQLSLVFGIGILMLLLSLFKVEKLVRIAFGSYLLLIFSLAFGTVILQWASHLQITPEQVFLGIKYASLATFLISAQPTIMLVLFVLGLRFFAQNSHLNIQLSSELFEKKMQTFIRGILSLGSIVSSLYFALSYFKGDMYERIFAQPGMIIYTPRIPLMALIIAIVSLFAASHLNLHFSIKKEDPPQL